MTVSVAISVEAGDWPAEEALRRLVEAMLGAAEAELPLIGSAPSELGLIFTDAAAITALNAEWRGKDSATNVLSFPAFPHRDGVLPPLLGDIVLAQESVASESALESKPFEHHLSHLLVHGLLHLLGHDHEDDAAAEVMEGLERRILARLAIPDPYL